MRREEREHVVRRIKGKKEKENRRGCKRLKIGGESRERNEMVEDARDMEKREKKRRKKV